MRIYHEQCDPKTLIVDLLAIPLFEDQKKLLPNAAALDVATGKMFSGAISQDKMEGKEGETVVLRTMGKIGAAKIVIMGAGKKPTGSIAMRKFAARLTQVARKQHAKSVAILLDGVENGGLEEVAEAISEGATLGDYRFLKYKDEELKKYTEEAIDSFTLLLPGEKRRAAVIERGLRKGEICARATMLARGLVNEPASEMTPTHLVRIAEALAKANPKCLSLSVFDEQALTKMGAGGILAVGRGSDEPSYMIHLIYKPKKRAKKKIVIVGKGITFDSGGLSIKPAQSMEDMKIDMAGCAAMLGVMSALPELLPDVEVHGISGICENMPSGKAVKPGDIVRTMNGKTIEILNTDAEGRVTLADTLHYGSTLKPDFLIDLATLTGAVMVALGQEVAGVFSNSKKLAEKLLAAANEEGELLWELPLVDEYRASMKSGSADLKNISGSSYGGAITAGVFLEEFVGKTPWAHLDIAGPAWAEKDTVPHQPIGATGFGVRTLLQFLENL
jgi:leucyl aminopeptidase